MDHPDNSTLIERLETTISGRTPTMTGGYCDTCNSPLATSDDETDYVYVYGDWHGDWRITSRTNCDECAFHLDERDLVEAVVKCELGPSPNGEAYPLYNPTVVEMNTSEGNVLRDGE